MKKIFKFSEFLNENYDEKVFGYDYDELLDNISDDDSGLMFSDPKDVLDSKIEFLKDLQKENQKIQIYRVIYSKSKKDIDINNIGHHFVLDLDDFHEEMLDYLYDNALEQNKKIKEDDVWLITAETSSDNIDYSETILTNSLHPNESEITIKDDKKIDIISIQKYYE